MATKSCSLPKRVRLSNANEPNFSKPPSGRLPGRLDEKYTAHVARRHTLNPQARAVADRLRFCEISRLSGWRPSKQHMISTYVRSAIELFQQLHALATTRWRT
jgi:hypothetical protein